MQGQKGHKHVRARPLHRSLSLLACRSFDAQLAVDTTLVSALHCDGTSNRGAGKRDGVALVAARRGKKCTNTELTAPGCRARLVMLAAEVGGVSNEEFWKCRWRCESLARGGGDFRHSGLCAG